MKKLLIMAAILVSFGLIPGSSGACIRVRNPAEISGPATLSEVMTDASVSPEGKALHVVTEFIATTPAIYLSARVNNAPPNTHVSAKWIYVKDDTGKEVNQELFHDSTTVTGTKYINFSHQAPSGTWAIGQYIVAMYLDDKEVTDARFSVKPVHAADVPTPTIQYFKAIPEAISTGQSVTLSWSTSDADTVSIAPSAGTALPPTGNKIVTPPNTMEYVLTASNSAGSTAMKVNVRVTSFFSDKPELIITDFWVEGDTAYYKIKNISEVNAKPSVTALYIEGVKRASSYVDVMGAGQERTQVFTNYQWQYETQHTYKLPVMVCADSTNVIGEYDENNNCLMLDW